MNTYTNNQISNYLKCLNWTTDSGSVYITASEGAPRGDYWTWMFYDTSVPIQLGSNHIAESAHFLVNGSTLSPSDYSNPNSSGKKGLTAGAAAGIAVVVTLLVSVLCGTAALFLWYQPRQKRRMLKAMASAAPISKVEEIHKPELGGNTRASNSASAMPPQTSAPARSSDTDLLPPRGIEMEDVPSTTSVVPRPELSAPTHLYEMDREKNNSSRQFWEMPDTGPGTNRAPPLSNELPSSTLSPVPIDGPGENHVRATLPDAPSIARKSVPSSAARSHDSPVVH
ncbi:hypothetical protein H2202_003432 [Exophiala xenobiotica]|nr:hypothetical protein H2202_003432 [Exophiala xenobiotica]